MNMPNFIASHSCRARTDSRWAPVSLASSGVSRGCAPPEPDTNVGIGGAGGLWPRARAPSKAAAPTAAVD